MISSILLKRFCRSVFYDEAKTFISLLILNVSLLLSTSAPFLYYGMSNINPMGFGDLGTRLSNGKLRFITGFMIWVVLQLFSMAMILLSSGFMLAYIIPFLPLMTWVLMSIGYLLTIIEAVAAAPLAVVMMVVPEGEGISGSRTERAIQMVVAIVLRPSLMIIGLIASISVSYVGFELLNTFFWQASSGILDINNIRSSDVQFQSAISSLFDFFAVLTIYVGLAYQMCQYTVSIMHKLADQILEWFAGGISRSFGENDISGTSAQAIGVAS